MVVAHPVVLVDAVGRSSGTGGRMVQEPRNVKETAAAAIANRRMMPGL